MVLDIIYGLPVPRDTFCSPSLSRHTTQVVVHPDFVVQVREPGTNEVAIQKRIVHFADKLHIREV